MTSSRNTFQAPIALLTAYQPIRPRAAAPAQRLIQPSYPVDFSGIDEVALMLTVHAIAGSPTAYTLTPRLQVGQAHINGPQWTNQRWFDVDPTDYIVAGSWFPPVTEAEGTTYSHTVTLAHLPQLWRIDLGESGPNAFTMTGGDNPGLSVSFYAYPKG